MWRGGRSRLASPLRSARPGAGGSGRNASCSRSQAFSNYQLGDSTVQDNDNNAHGTVWNADADALVRQDPQRCEYVGAPNFGKGVDY